MSSRNPVFDQFPRRIAKRKRLASVHEVGFEGRATILPIHLQQAAAAHGDDVERGERSVDGANVGEGNPLVAGGQNIVRLQVQGNPVAGALGQNQGTQKAKKQNRLRRIKKTKDSFCQSASYSHECDFSPSRLRHTLTSIHSFAVWAWPAAARVGLTAKSRRWYQLSVAQSIVQRSRSFPQPVERPPSSNKSSTTVSLRRLQCN